MSRHIFLLLFLVTTLVSAGNAQSFDTRNGMRKMAENLHRKITLSSKQSSVSAAGKGATVKTRLIASSYYINSGIQDSTQYYYTGYRGSELPILSSYYPLFFHNDPYGNAPYQADSQLVWGVDNNGVFRYDGQSNASYNATDRLINTTTRSTIYSLYYRIEYYYNTQGQMVKMRSYDTTTGGITATLHPVTDEYLGYDAQGNHIYDSSYSLTFNRPLAKSHISYNSAGKAVLSKGYNFNSLNQWLLVDSIPITYYSNNLEKTFDIFFYDPAGVLTYAKHDSSGYSSNHPLYTYLRTDEYGNGSNVWRPVSLERNHLNAAGDNYDTLTFAQWDANLNSFTYAQRTNGIFNQDGTLSKGLLFFNGSTSATITNYYYQQYNAPSGINTINANTAIGIYPNPASSLLYIKDGASAGSIIVTDMTGKTMIVQALSGSLDISGLPAGIYCARIVTNNGHCSNTYKFEKL